MSDLKSKLPDMKELGEITSKLFKDIKTSVGEIMCMYKKKREEEAEAELKKAKTEVKEAAAEVKEAKAEKAAEEKKEEK